MSPSDTVRLIDVFLMELFSTEEEGISGFNTQIILVRIYIVGLREHVIC